MSDTLNFTEIDTQNIELLPARTVMSMFRTAGTTGTTGTAGGTSTAPTGGGKGNALDMAGDLLKSDPKELLGKILAIFGGK